MSHISTIIKIHRPIEQVYDYVTTPVHWPSWQPTSLKVSGSIESPLELGERVVEEVKLAGRFRTIDWTVREREAPRRWVAEGELEGGGLLEVVYTLKSEGSDTLLERQAAYKADRLLLALLVPLLKGRARQESETAFERLKQNLEQDIDLW